MKKTGPVLYTIFVIIVLIGVIGYFVWESFDIRAKRIANFTDLTQGYTRQLADSLVGDRNIDSETAIAESMLKNNPILIAVQVYSYDEGLRLSVVKATAGEVGSTAIADSDFFKSLLNRIRYQVVIHPMRIDSMPGMEAYFVGITLTNAEIRANLLIILITVAGLFIITLAVIFLQPRTVNNDEIEDSMSSPEIHDNDDEDIEELDISSLEEEVDEDDMIADDLDDFSFDIDIGESPNFDDELPDIDEMQEDISMDTKAKFIERLDSELERAASFNQDLAIIFYNTGGIDDEKIRNAYDFKDLIFTLENNMFAVIEINQDLDQAMVNAENIVRDSIIRSGNTRIRVGITSRNGRLISAERIYNEAITALNKSDKEQNIVAFRTDPQKYREYIKEEGL